MLGESPHDLGSADTSHQLIFNAPLSDDLGSADTSHQLIFNAPLSDDLGSADTSHQLIFNALLYLLRGASSFAMRRAIAA